MTDLPQHILNLIDVGRWGLAAALVAMRERSGYNLGVENAVAPVFVCPKRAVFHDTGAAFSTNEANAVEDGLLRSEVKND